MKTKKWFAVLAVVVMVAMLFVGCAKAPVDEPVDEPVGGDATDAPVENGDKQLVFGQICHDRNIEWVNFGVQNFEYACAELGVGYELVDAQNDMEKVLAGMEDLLAKGVDAVSVYSFSPDLDKRVAEMAREAGIPIVFENAVPADDVDRDSVTCCTYYDIGYAVAKMIGDQFPGSKFAYIMGQPGMNITEPYLDGLEAAMADGADTEMVANYPTNWTAEEAMSATDTLIQSGTEFDVIFANNEQIAQGVIRALDGAGLDIPVIATGGSELGIEMLKSGELFGTVAAPTSYMGMLSAKKLYMLCNGEEVEEMTYLPLLPATKENVDEIIPWPAGPAVVEAIGGLK